MDLINVYKSILRAAGFKVTDDNCVSFGLEKESKPAIIKGKRLVLPTPEHLANPDWSKRVVFHPASENIMHGESAVLEKFRSAMNLRLNVTVACLAAELLKIASSPARHAKLTPDQSEFLTKLRDVDEKMYTTFMKIVEAMPANQNLTTIVSIYIKRSGSVSGKRYQRVAVVKFPLYDDLKEGRKDCFGVAIRNKDREAYLRLLEYMIPGIETPEYHNRGSDSVVAPNLDALMKGFMSVAGPLNDLVALFNNQIDDAQTLEFDSEWVEAFDNLEALLPQVRMIPMQTGNEGQVPKPAVAPVAPAPAPTTAQFPTPGAQFYPQQPGQFQAPPPPTPVRTANGLDFDSVLRSQPHLAAQVQMNPMYPGFAPQPVNPLAARTSAPPRWATPQMSGWGNQPQQQFGQPFQGGRVPV